MSALRGICAINAKEIFVKTCQIHGGQPTRMLKATYIRMCLDRRAKRYSGCGFGNAVVHPECFDCATGEMIAAGKDFPRPACVSWIEISDCGLRIADCGLYGHGMPCPNMPARLLKTGRKLKETIMNEKLWKTEWSITWRDIPGAELPDIKKGGLVGYWLAPVAPAGAIANCVNCGRTVKVRPLGLCGSCEAAGTKLRGPELLDALATARVRLQGSDKAARMQKKIEAADSGLDSGVPLGLTVPRMPAKQEKSPPRDGEVILISPLADIGARYIRLGEMMQDMRTNIGDLTAAAHAFGLRLQINISEIHNG